MTKILITFLSYIFLLFNSAVIASESDKKLKIGLLAPFSGEYKDLGESLLLSTQLALDEIGNDIRKKHMLVRARRTGQRDKARDDPWHLYDAKPLLGASRASDLGAHN